LIRDTYLPGGSGDPHVAGVAGIQDPPSELPDHDDRDLDAPRSSSSSSTSNSSTISDDVDSADREERDEDDLQEESADGLVECSTRLRHISKAGEYLLEADRRERARTVAVERNIEDLEGAYRSYIDYMTARDRDPLHETTTIPEESDNPPPP
jgi:hypothetical protein